MTALLDHIRALGAGIARLARRADEFTCGMCDRNARCGLPPEADCEHRLTQIAERQNEPARWPQRDQIFTGTPRPPAKPLEL